MNLKQNVITICLVVCGLFVNCTKSDSKPAPAPNPEPGVSNELKVMVWNVWHGGHSKEYGEEACEGTRGILKNSGADVILMIETYGCAVDVAADLGYNYKLLSNNLSIYSRYPITDNYTFVSEMDPFKFGGVEINMKGKRVRLFNTWLNYLPDCRDVPVNKTEEEIITWENEGGRVTDIEKILLILEPFMAEANEIPIIMGGDFNCHSHLDWIEATKNLFNHGGCVVNWPVSRKMVDAGFKDSFREVNPNPAKSIGTTWMHAHSASSPERSDRIDYIYSKGNGIEAVSSQTYYEKLGQRLPLNNKDFFYGSDHGFVLSTFRIDF